MQSEQTEINYFQKEILKNRKYRKDAEKRSDENVKGRWIK